MFWFLKPIIWGVIIKDRVTFKNVAIKDGFFYFWRNLDYKVRIGENEHFSSVKIGYDECNCLEKWKQKI